MSLPYARREPWRCRGLAVVVLYCSPVPAQDSAQVIARAVSDYVYRNYSRSDDGPAVQVQASTKVGTRSSMGIGVSSVDLADARWEMSANISGVVWQTDDWYAALTLVGYLYDGELAGGEGHYAEPSATLWFRQIASFKLGAALDLYGLGDSSPYAEIGSRYPLSDVFSLSALLGFEHLMAVDGENHVYWNIGATHYFSPRVALDLRYYGSRGIMEDMPRRGTALLEPLSLNDRVVVGLSLSF